MQAQIPEGRPGMIGGSGQGARQAGEVKERGASKNFKRKEPLP